MSKSLKIKLLFVALIILSFVFGAIFNGIAKSFTSSPSYNIEDVIHISRSPDWKYENGFYVAVILVEKSESGFNVRCKVHVGNHNYFEEIPLGSTTSLKEAYARWGEVAWTEKELLIGSSEVTPVVIDRARIENHR